MQPCIDGDARHPGTRISPVDTYTTSTCSTREYSCLRESINLERKHTLVLVLRVPQYWYYSNSKYKYLSTVVLEYLIGT